MKFEDWVKLSIIQLQWYEEDQVWVAKVHDQRMSLLCHGDTPEEALYEMMISFKAAYKVHVEDEGE